MAVVQASQKVGAYTKFITDVKQGQYGEYRSVLFLRNDKPAGKEQEVWRSMKPHEAQQFTKGQFVHLIPTKRDGKDTWDIEIPAVPSDPRTQQSVPMATPTPINPIAPMGAAPPSKAETITPGQKVQWAKDIDNSARLFRRCLEAAQHHCGELVGGDVSEIRAIATTLFEQSFR